MRRSVPLVCPMDDVPCTDGGCKKGKCKEQVAEEARAKERRVLKKFRAKQLRDIERQLAKREVLDLLKENNFMVPRETNPLEGLSFLMALLPLKN